MQQVCHDLDAAAQVRSNASGDCAVSWCDVVTLHNTYFLQPSVGYTAVSTSLPRVFIMLMVVRCRKGQATNEMLFGGVSLGQNQQESLTVMQETAEKGIKVDV
jgi:hypothetical protein